MTEKDFFDLKYQVLIEEWKMTNSNIARFDGIIFLLRGWALTLATAGVSFAFTQKDASICVLLLFPVIAIWLFDALFKMFQRKFTKRFREIEDYMSSSLFELDFLNRKMQSFTLPQIGASFARKRNLKERVSDLVEAAFLHNVWLFYFLTLSLILAARGIIEIGA